jgi:ribosomal protein S12 methylthiotransferase
MKKVYLKNLGCPKNEVDGNILLGMLEKENLRITDRPDSADIIIVNSCGFIAPAKEESIDEVLNLAELKKTRPVKLVLAGCLAQRYKEIIEKDMPEVDLVVGISNLSRAKDQIIGLSNGDKSAQILPKKYTEYPVIQNTSRLPYAYLKISDGCDNFCTYCAIPLIRGRHRSRQMSAIVDEARQLAERGIVELILVAQDITQYGIDIYGQRRLVELLKKLEKIEGVKWIRLLYTHPAHYEDRLTDYLSESEKVLPYLDLPLQHISDKILKAMNRKVTSKQIRGLIEKLRDNIQNLVLRTTYIIGFPGEEDIDFEQLWNFQHQYGIERVGVFPYSREEDTGAYSMKPEVTEQVISERIDRLMTLVMDQSLEYNSRLSGKKIEVIIDEKHKDGYYIARRFDQTPEIDGYTKLRGKYRAGHFYDVRVTGFEAYDLEAERWKE